MILFRMKIPNKKAVPFKKTDPVLMKPIDEFGMKIEVHTPRPLRKNIQYSSNNPVLHEDKGGQPMHAKTPKPIRKTFNFEEVDPLLHTKRTGLVVESKASKPLVKYDIEKIKKSNDPVAHTNAGPYTTRTHLKKVDTARKSINPLYQVKPDESETLNRTYTDRNKLRTARVGNYLGSAIFQA